MTTTEKVEARRRLTEKLYLFVTKSNWYGHIGARPEDVVKLVELLEEERDEARDIVFRLVNNDEHVQSGEQALLDGMAACDRWFPL